MLSNINILRGELESKVRDYSDILLRSENSNQ